MASAPYHDESRFRLLASRLRESDLDGGSIQLHFSKVRQISHGNPITYKALKLLGDGFSKLYNPFESSTLVIP